MTVQVDERVLDRLDAAVVSHPGFFGRMKNTILGCGTSAVDAVAAYAIGKAVGTSPAESPAPVTDRKVTDQNPSTKWGKVVKQISQQLSGKLFAKTGGFGQAAQPQVNAATEHLINTIFVSLAADSPEEFAALSDEERTKKLVANVIAMFQAMPAHEESDFKDLTDSILERVFPDKADDKNLPPLLGTVLSGTGAGTIYAVTLGYVDTSVYTWDSLRDNIASYLHETSKSMDVVYSVDHDALESAHPGTAGFLETVTANTLETIGGIQLPDLGLAAEEQTFIQAAFSEALQNEDVSAGLRNGFAAVVQAIFSPKKGQTPMARVSEFSTEVLKSLVKNYGDFRTSIDLIKGLNSGGLKARLKSFAAGKTEGKKFYAAEAKSILDNPVFDAEAAKELLIKEKTFAYAEKVLSKELAAEKFGGFFPSYYPAESVFPMIFAQVAGYIGDLDHYISDLLPAKEKEGRAILDDADSKGGLSSRVDSYMNGIYEMIEKKAKDGMIEGYPEFLNSIIRESLATPERKAILRKTLESVGFAMVGDLQNRGILHGNFLSESLAKSFAHLTGTTPDQADLPSEDKFLEAASAKLLEAVIPGGEDSGLLTESLKGTAWGQANFYTAEYLKNLTNRNDRVLYFMDQLAGFTSNPEAATAKIDAVREQVALGNLGKAKKLFKKEVVNVAVTKAKEYVDTVLLKDSKLPSGIKKFFRAIVGAITHFIVSNFVAGKLWKFIADEASDRKIQKLLWDFITKLGEKKFDSDVDEGAQQVSVAERIKDAFIGSNLLPKSLSGHAASGLASYLVGTRLTDYIGEEPESDDDQLSQAGTVPSTPVAT
jgi:hypothetical protein